MDMSKVGILGLIAAEVPAPFDWLEAVKSVGVLGLFAYYIFVHEPRVRKAEHERRMEELRTTKVKEG